MQARLARLLDTGGHLLSRAKPVTSTSSQLVAGRLATVLSRGQLSGEYRLSTSEAIGTSGACAKLPGMD